MYDRSHTIFLSMLALVAEQHGCRLVDVDPDTRMIRFDGPDENRLPCAMAMQSLVDECGLPRAEEFFERCSA